MRTLSDWLVNRRSHPMIRQGNLRLALFSALRDGESSLDFDRHFLSTRPGRDGEGYWVTDESGEWLRGVEGDSVEGDDYAGGPITEFRHVKCADTWDQQISDVGTKKKKYIRYYPATISMLSTLN